MRYAFLIYYDPKVHAEMSKEKLDAHMRANDAYVAQYGDKINAAAALHDTEKATTVRVREGKTVTSDGPFAETKEQLGGFSVIECDNLDEAIQLASRTPDAVHGSIEIRPVWGFHLG
jgi:hypothetical protein